MELLLQEIQKLSKILDINKILADVFSDSELQLNIIDKIRYDQLFKDGVSEENVRLGSYSPYTIQIKESKGQPYDHITLKDTGDFYNSMKIAVFDTYILINAEGEKTDESGETKDLFVVYNYAGNLLGLTDTNMDWLIKRIKTPIIERIEAAL